MFLKVHAIIINRCQSNIIHYKIVNNIILYIYFKCTNNCYIATKILKPERESSTLVRNALTRALKFPKKKVNGNRNEL
jgi:hypothetical protein